MVARWLARRVRWLSPGLCWLVFAACSRAAGSAEFDYPIAVATAPDGTIFVADLNMPGILKVSGDQISTLFQADKKFRTPLNRVRCVAVDHEGRLLAGDTSTRQVYRFGAEGTPEPLLKGLGIGMPMALAPAPNGDLYVADLELHRIWKVPADGGEQQLFAEVPAPRGLFLDKQGRLWVVSHGKHQLVRIAPDATIEPIVTERVFDFPHNVVVDEQSNAYVTDGYSKAVWRVPEGGKPEKWVEGEPFAGPVGLTWLGDDLLIADPRLPGLVRITKDRQTSKLDLRAAP
jgi:sugar lactone lactonase YvrE